LVITVQTGKFFIIRSVNQSAEYKKKRFTGVRELQGLLKNRGVNHEGIGFSSPKAGLENQQEELFFSF